MAISPLLIYPPLVMLVTIVGWLVTAYFACVKEAITDCIHFDASTKLRKLKTDILPELKRILWGVEGQKFMEAAKEKNSAVYILELRIKDLKSTLHEAEDTLDLLEYHRLKMKLHGSRFRGDLVQTFRLLCRFLRLNKRWSYDAVNTTYQEDDTAVDSFLSTISWSGFIAKWKLKRRIEKMENTIEVHKSSIVSINAETEIINRREHIRSDGRLTVYGRDKERDIIIKKLYDGAAASSSSSRCYSVVGIHGIAGSGKTTLAKYIVNYIEADKHKPFGYIKRIHMSKTFSLNDIYSDILGKENVDQDHQRLQEDLKKKLKGIRFLFVLDDLWENNNHKLDELVNSLNVGAPGSKILVTSRREDIATFLCGTETIAISDLGQQQYFKMFMNYALGDTSVNDQEYIYIGEQIAAKLHRSPLAAALVGGQLRMKRNIRFWSTVAELDVLNETRGVIWWSYQQLDVDIRRCFEYCSIFPRRYELERDELVRMWAAQGFVAATEGMEDIANTYVHELVACSFLQVTRSTATTVYYTMHDLLRDLVEEIGGRDYFRIDNDFTGKVPEDVIHLFIETYDGPMLAQQIVKLKRLRTIIINNVRKEKPIEEVVFKHMFMSLQKLRVLAFRRVHPKGDAMFSTFSFPACISHSKHLRYLLLCMSSGIKIILPSTLSQLYHMQFLGFGICGRLEFSGGEDMANLINLHHIKSYTPLGFAIGKLTSLMTLPFFYVIDDPAYKLEQLEHLNKLQGKLIIYGLENVKTKADAVQAKLAAKTRLKDLHLRGDYSQSDSSAEATAQVFDGLCPPESLENLSLDGSNALRCPSWMSEPYFKQLRTLELLTCSLETLPENMKQCFKSLVYLRIFGCKNIRSLPNLPRSLTRIEITACDDEFMKSCQQPGHENWKKIQHIPIRDLR